jgi:hypothetical protein
MEVCVLSLSEQDDQDEIWEVLNSMELFQTISIDISIIYFLLIIWDNIFNHCLL